MNANNVGLFQLAEQFISNIFLRSFTKNISLFLAFMFIFTLAGKAYTQTCADVKLESEMNSIISGSILHPRNSTIAFKIMPSDDQSYTVSLNLKDETGKILSSHEQKFKGQDLLIKSKVAGYNEANISVINNNTKTVCFNKTLSLATLDDAKAPTTKFGIWEINAEPKLMKTIGAGWSRKFWSLNCYKLVEGQLRCVPTNYENKKLIPINGVRVIGTLAHGLPEWLYDKKLDGGNAKGLYPAKDLTMLTQIAAQFASDQGGLPEYFELYNEPDVEWKGSKRELVEFQAAIAKGLKMGSPNTKILSASLWSIRMPYIIELLENGLIKHVDGIAMHAYVGASAPEKDFIERIISLRAYLDKNVQKGYPLVLTEFGWTTGVGPKHNEAISELSQAQYIARAALLISAQDIKAAVFFNLLWSKPSNPGQEGYSYLRLDGTPKPVFVSFATVLRWIGNWDNPGIWIKPSKGVHVVVNSKSGIIKGAAWTENNGGHIIIPGKLLKMEDMMGRTISPNTDGKIQISGSPVYFEISNASLANIIVKQ